MRRKTWVVLSLLVIPVMAVAAIHRRTRQAFQAAGMQEFSFIHQGRSRWYTLAAPAVSGQVPLVLVLHGGGGDPENMRATTHFEELARREGFIAVYPAGTGPFPKSLLTWNAGRCCGKAQKENVDDVSFLAAVVDDVRKRYAVDPRRIFITGLSNGGMMTYLMVCRRADLFAAAAPVIASLTHLPCKPGRPVPLMAVNGTNDEHVPYNGGVGKKSLQPIPHLSVTKSTGVFISNNRCTGAPNTSRTGAVEFLRYGGCVQDADVTVVKVNGQGHAWPGGQPGWRGGDPPNMDWNATAGIWEFFKAHPMP